jgi:hypothetical protein
MNGSSGTDGRAVMDIFDEVEHGLACRVCGALVAATGSYGQIHLDWHEATNGA